MTITTLPTNADLAAQASKALTDVGLSANTAWRIVELMPPAGHHELVKALDGDPNALRHMLDLSWGEFARRFRTTDTNAIRIQTEIAAAIR